MLVYVLQDDTFGSDGFWAVYSSGENAQKELDGIDGRNKDDFEIYRVELDGDPLDWYLWKDGKVSFNGVGEWVDETSSCSPTAEATDSSPVQ